MIPKDPYTPSKKPKRLVSTARRSEQFMGRREWVMVFMITAALALTLFAFPNSCSQQYDDNPGSPFTFTPMVYPDLKQLPQTITTDELAHFRGQAEEYLERPDRLFGQPLAIPLEWSRLQLPKDLERAPLPKRLSAMDLSRTSADSNFYILSGTQVVVTGQIIEKFCLHHHQS